MASDGIILPPGVSLEDLETYVSHVREGQYLLVAGITLLLYDYFCTLGEEVSFVWGKAPYLVPGKVLFALNRYPPVFTLIIRLVIFNESTYNAEIHAAIVEVVLLLRVWVIYGRNKWIGVALWTFCLVCLGVALGAKYLPINTSLPFVTLSTYGDTGCSKVVPAQMFLIYGVVTIAESVFFAMLLYKAYQMTRNSSDTPILTALLKQGTIYYFIVLAILTITMFAPFSDKLFWPIANAFPMVPIVSIACNRLILSLRGMVFSENAVRTSRVGTSGSGSHGHSSSGSGFGKYHPRLPPTGYVHSARDYAPIGDAQKGAALDADRPTSGVIFTGDQKDQKDHYRLDESLVALDRNSGYDRGQQQQGGESGMEESWSAMEEGDKNASVHQMIPIRG